MKIVELTQTQNEKWNTDTKQWKFHCELQRINTKQENELHALKQKSELSINEFNIKRKKDFE
jgi:hypothetical protein